MAGRTLNLGLGSALGNANVFDTLRQNTLDKQRQTVVDEQLAASQQVRAAQQQQQQWAGEDRAAAVQSDASRQKWFEEAMTHINADPTLTQLQKIGIAMDLRAGRVPKLFEQAVKAEVERVSGLTNDKGQKVTRGIDPTTGETKWEQPEYVAPEKPKPPTLLHGVMGKSGPETQAVDEQGNPLWSRPEYREPKAGPSEATALANEMARLRIQAETDKQNEARAGRDKAAAEGAESTQSALDSVEKLLDAKGLGAGLDSSYGAYEMRGFTQGAQDFKAERDRLAALLTLPNLGKLKGPLSDNDLKFIRQVSSTLSNDRISDAAARTELVNLQNWLRSKGAVSKGGGAGVKVLSIEAVP